MIGNLTNQFNVFLCSVRIMEAGYSLTEIAITIMMVDDIKLKRLESLEDPHDKQEQLHNKEQHQNPRQLPTWNRFAVLREKTTRALKTLAQAQPKVTWAKSA